MLKKIIFLIAGIVLFYIAFVLLRSFWLIHISLKIQDGAQSFSISPPAPAFHVLCLGDSTAFGTGTRDNHASTAGRLSADFPQAAIENRSENGKKTGELAQELVASPLDHFDLIVIQIGGNDILRFTNTQKLNEDIQTVLKEAKKRSERVLLLTSGDVGTAPFFLPPFNRLWSERTKTVRDIFMKSAMETGVVYVDLYGSDVDDVFRSDIKRYYSPDLLHPAGDGYALWYEQIKKSLMASSYWTELQILENQK